MSETKSSPAAAETAPVRKKRYARTAAPAGLLTLTPTKIAMLRFLAEMRFLSLPQLARLCCPADREDLSQKSARKHLRTLFDAGLVDVLPVARLALAPADAPNDATLLYGSAPNVYTPTGAGLQMLYKAGLICREWAKRLPAVYGPKNSLFLSHELQVRDVRVWLERCAYISGGEQKVVTWRDGQDAAIDLGQDKAPCWLRPDAWFVYQVKPAQSENGKPTMLVAFVEVDRGTERGTRRWQEKISTYDVLLTREKLHAITGYQNARVLVFTPDINRQNALCLLLKEEFQERQRMFWLAEKSVLSQFNLSLICWRQAGEIQTQPLLPATVLL